MTDLKTLKQLVKLMVDNDLSELDMEGEGEKIKLRRRNGQPDVQVVTPTPVPAAAVATPTPATAAPAAAAPVPTEDAPATGQTIDSPMVGTFYASPSPDAKAFVSVGDKVDPETVVAIVEAMKVFNEIKAETSGTIKRVVVENGQSVEFGQPLFEIE